MNYVGPLHWLQFTSSVDAGKIVPMEQDWGGKDVEAGEVDSRIGL